MRPSRWTSTRAAAGLVALLVVLVLPASAGAVAQILPGQAGLEDLDARSGRVAPSAAAKQAVSDLGATVEWNRYRTPASLLARSGFLSTSSGGDAAMIARGFIAAHRELFRLSAADVDALQLVNDAKLVASDGHAVLFRQRFGDLAAGHDGMITVGVSGGRVAYVSSSAAGSQDAPAAATLTPAEAWLAAAHNAGVDVSHADLGTLRNRGGWTRFGVKGLATPSVPGTKDRVDQRARLVAFPTYTQGVRAAFETIMLDVDGGRVRAYRSFVDARTGEVLLRSNEVKQAADDENGSGSFSGSTADGANGCGKPQVVNASGAYSIAAFATANVPSNDIVLRLLGPDGKAVASSDTGTSPEAVTYDQPGGTIPDGAYQLVVCKFDDPTVPATGDAFDYTGGYTVNTTAAAPSAAGNPSWDFFEASPTDAGTDTRVTGCYLSAAGCDLGLSSTAARGPWDAIPQTGTPSFTTQGNAARTAEARTTPLSPGPFGFMPTSLSREYRFPFANQWATSRCDPTALAVPGSGADISAAVANLFSGHNRFHDFAYHLGFTERNYNLQQSNFGATEPGRDGDPELGNVQAGALTGGAPTYEGRDNANQIALNDGIPGITNQYLFQPIAGAFYGPCVDGDLDTSVFGHEYTHAISNRMVGGPDDGLTGFQGGAMGESWSDLVALEYLHAHDYVPADGENPWAEGAYATGNKRVGIRDYALNDNPLNYADVGFDTTGPEVHADGEIWNGVNYDIRQALVRKYDAQFPSTDTALQLRCADGRPGGNAPEAPLPPEQCPGNRRWIQIVFDAFLLQQGDTSMLTARDAYLAADRMRFGAANQAELWNAFAKRGMGQSASTDTTEDDQPTPGYDSPLANNATVTFATTDAGSAAAIPSTVYIGRYEARATPVADTDPATPLGPTAKLVPGAYDVYVRSAGHGLRRFALTVAAGQTLTKSFALTPNVASKSSGASASGAGTNLDDLIDDTESTTWDAATTTPVDVTPPTVTVSFAGAKPVKTVAVSALLDPDDPDGDEGRFSALRRFKVESCDGRTANCSLPTSWKPLYTSPADAFPGTVPRPLAPDLTLRTFDVPDTVATQVRFTALENQCTGGPAYQGEQDADPTNATDCVTGSDQGTVLHAAEFEVFGQNITG
jgi:extracellular elastinolytic metalloproteinase